MATEFKSQLDSLGNTFGALDNQVRKWITQTELIQSFFPKITAVLAQHFPTASYPVKTFEQAAETYQILHSKLGNDQTQSHGYLNLRFYIMLNGFLSACDESLEKFTYNQALHPVTLVEKSYYTPYFFDRVTLSREEMLTMLSADLTQLETLSLDPKGILQAIRIRKGTTLTFMESYCPLHPELYPLVADLEAIVSRKDNATIEFTIACFRKIQSAL